MLLSLTTHFRPVSLFLLVGAYIVKLNQAQSLPKTNLGRVSFQSAYGIDEDYIYDYGNYTLHCTCDQNGSVYGWTTHRQHSPKKSADQFVCHLNSSTERSVIAIPLDTMSLDWGKYYCTKDGVDTNETAEVYERICVPRSDSCNKQCNVSNEDQYCLEHASNPGGVDWCRSTLDFCSHLYGIPGVFVCPQEKPMFTDLCKASLSGLTRYSLYVINDFCNANEVLPSIDFDGRKFHLEETFVYNRSIKNLNYAFTVANGSLRYVRIQIASFYQKFVDDLLTVENPGSFRLPNAFHLHSPQQLRIAVAIYYNSYTKDQRVTVPKFRNKMIVFKEKLFFRRLRDENMTLKAIKVVLPNLLDPHFELNLEATFDGENVQVINNTVPVTKNGTLNVTLYQTYFSCFPHRRIIGDSVIQSETFTDDDIYFRKPDPKNEDPELLGENDPEYVADFTTTTPTTKPTISSTLEKHAGKRNILSGNNNQFELWKIVTGVGVAVLAVFFLILGIAAKRHSNQEKEASTVTSGKEEKSMKHVQQEKSAQKLDIKSAVTSSKLEPAGTNASKPVSLRQLPSAVVGASLNDNSQLGEPNEKSQLGKTMRSYRSEKSTLA